MTDKHVTEVKGAVKSAEDVLREYRADQARLDAQAPGGERWRKPVKPVAVVDDPSYATHDGNVLRGGINATFDAATIERFRQGYACLRCWEPFQEPFPETCPLCSYACRANQPHDFEHEFAGEKWVGPTTSLGDEFERMLHNGEKRRHQPGSSILIPGRDF